MFPSGLVELASTEQETLHRRLGIVRQDDLDESNPAVNGDEPQPLNELRAADELRHDHDVPGAQMRAGESNG